MGLLSWLFRAVYGRRMKAWEGLPGPRPSFPFGNALDFRGRMDRPWEVCAEYGEQYGAQCVFWMMGEPVLLLQDPALIREVMEEDRLAYYKDSPCPELLPVLTDSSPNINNGAEWQTRREVSPFVQEYAARWRAAQLPAIRTQLRAGARLLVEKTADDPVKLQPFLQRLTCDAFSQAVVGEALPEPVYEDFMTLARQGSHRMLSGLPFGKDLDRAGRDARERWLAHWQGRIDAARTAEDGDRTDLIAAVLRAGTTLPDAALAAELGNVFFGGAFSVPSAATTALYFLTANPDKRAALRAALDQLGPDPDAAALEGCEYLDGVVREGLRLRTSVPLWERRVQRDRPAQLGGRELPANARIFIVNWRLHWDPERWPEPDQFQPERWANGVADANPYGSDYFFPLGRGPRICLGIDFAIYYLKLLTAVWTAEFDVACGEGQPYDHGQRYFFGVRMPWGLKVRVASPTS